MSKNKIHLLICGHDLKFLTPVIKRFESNDDYEVRILLHNGHHITNESDAENALKWANVIFCEWALGNATWFSQRKRSDQVLIVRLHLQEVQARDRIDFIYSTVWENVDRLILITQHVYDWIRKEFPVLVSRTSLVYNPIPAKTTFNLPKSSDSRFFLGLVGVVPARKRLDLAVDLLKTLHAKDNRYKLRVKGALPYDYSWMASRKDEMAWYDKVFSDLKELKDQGAIIFDPHDPNMAEWYQSIGHIISVSDFEGSHQAVAEGMAAGAIPVIRDWEGANRIYPDKYVASTLDQMAQQVFRNSELNKFEHESNFCREFSQSRFDIERVCSQIESIVVHELINKTTLIDKPTNEILLSTPSFLIVAYIPIGSRSGYRIRVEQEMQILIQLGCKVHLLCLIPYENNKNEEYTNLKLDHIEELLNIGCNVTIYEISDFFKMNIEENDFKEVIYKITNIINNEKIDILHAEALYCARICQFVKNNNQSIIISVDWHGVIPEESKMGGAHENRIKALEQEEIKLLQQVDLNIFVSKTMGLHYSKKYNINNIRKVIIPCCVNDIQFNLNPPTNEVARSDNELRFIYVGTMTDWQCGSEMIRLFSYIYKQDDNCRFTILAPEVDHSKVYSYIAKYELPLDSIIIRSVPHTEVSEILGSADIAVFLRKNDTVNIVSSPTKFGEYIAAGLPVLMTHGIGDYSELALKHNIGKCFDYEVFDNNVENIDYLIISEIISWAYDCRKNKEQLSIKCKSIARDELMWEPAAINWIEGYQNA